MSIQAVAWVLDHSPTRKLDRLVLIALANHADERGECYPSVERIAAEAGTTPVQARRILTGLAEGGHVVRIINGSPDERMRKDRRTNLYRILDGGAQNVPPWLERATAERAHGRASSDDTGARPARERATAERAPNHQLEPSLEPSVEPSTPSADFERFWQAYPKARRIAKPDARAAFALAAKKAPPEEIIAAAERYTADPNRVDEFTPYPQKWLKQERWNAPPEPRRLQPMSAARAKEQRTLDAMQRRAQAKTNGAAALLPDDLFAIGQGDDQ